MFDSYDAKYFELRDSTRNTGAYESDALFVKNCIDNLGYHPNTVVDYGCGEMYFTSYLEEIFANTLVFDVSEKIRSKPGYIKKRFTPGNSELVGHISSFVFRGLFQHLPEPFTTIRYIVEDSHPEVIYFLATPNCRSIYYLLNETLPCLDPANNYYIPSPKMLQGLMERLGYQLMQHDFPYLRSGYASPLSDHLKFMENLVMRGRKRPVYPFWGSMFNSCFVKI
jgi:hypothetical protein